LAPGAPDDVSAFLATWRGRPTVAIVDLDQLTANIRHLRDVIGPSVRLMAVVKANGYGHGAVAVARHALVNGVDALAVATVDEGLQLRSAGIGGEILVIGPIGMNERERAVGHGLSLVVASERFAGGLAGVVRRIGAPPARVHLKIDSGMHRFGCAPGEAVAVARAIVVHPELHWAGCMTHLATADEPDTRFTWEQAARFDAAVAALRANDLGVPTQHIANSAGTLRFPDLHREMVRIGIAVYGLRPDPAMPLPAPMAPVLSIQSRVARVSTLPAGEGVNYGRTYRAEADETVALVPIGYADGYPRTLTGQTTMVLGGQRAPLLGRVTMDQAVVRVPDGVFVQPGDPVIIAGNGSARSGDAPTLDDLAAFAGTIGYELAVRLAARLPRLYVEHGQVVAVDDLTGRQAFS
jgi:alanine racemase